MKLKLLAATFLKPQNTRLCYKTVNDWVDQWCKK